MSESARNRIAKLLTAVGGIALLFSIVAVTTERSCKVIGDGSGCEGFAVSRRAVAFAVACVVIGLCALAAAIRIRRRMGGPLVGPWQHW